MCGLRTLTNPQKLSLRQNLSVYAEPEVNWYRFGGMAIRVELIVRDAGADLLRYNFGSLADASEMLVFLKDFFSEATFIIQPLRH